LKKRSILVCFIAVLVSGLFMVGCKKSEDNSNAITPETEVAAEAEELMEIETLSGVIYYPAKWKDSIEVNETQEDENNNIVFCAKVAEKEFELFELTVGKKDSMVIGSLTNSEGNKNDVYVELKELGDMEELSVEDQDLLYAMQEGINVIIENLQ